MTDRINAEKAVRRALEAALSSSRSSLRQQVPDRYLELSYDGVPVYGTEDAPDFPIWWPNVPFFVQEDGKPDIRPPMFIRVTHHPSPPRPRTIGPNPRILLRGHTMIGLYIPEGDGQDLIDNLANAAQSAYPYAAVFTRDGFEVHIELVDPKPAYSVSGRFYEPVHVNWSCWRTTP